MFILLVSFVIIVYPRFNGNDIGLIKPFVGGQEGVRSPDVQNYINYTNYFHGTLPIDSLEAPFSYRPAVPFLASLLPLPPLTAVVMVNILASLISVVCIYYLLTHHGFHHGLCMIGCLLFIVSFPLMYYSSAGYIDASAICVITTITTAAVTSRYAILPLLFVIGALVKEVTIISFPLVIVYVFYQRKQIGHGKAAVILCLSIAAFLLTSFLVRSQMTIGHGYLWKPSMQSIQENLVRPKTYISFLLTLGIVGFAGFAQIFYDLKSRVGVPLRTFVSEYQYTPYLAGISASFALSLYAVVSAYADGRFVWTSYPFLIPLAVKFIERKYLNRDTVSGTRS